MISILRQTFFETVVSSILVFISSSCDNYKEKCLAFCSVSSQRLVKTKTFTQDKDTHSKGHGIKTFVS